MKRFHLVHSLCLVSTLSIFAIAPAGAQETAELVTTPSAREIELPIAEQPSTETTQLVTTESARSLELPLAEKQEIETTDDRVNLPADNVAEKSSSSLTVTDEDTRNNDLLAGHSIVLREDITPAARCGLVCAR